MLKDSRSLSLDVCDYNNHALCSLYDNTADVSGQATEVYVITERNGWKELTFRLPATCFTAEGEEPNFRLQYLIADYRIRLQTEKETDWYLISEPKIFHDKESHTYEVTAEHISCLLKTKNLGLEFSDDEGNNVGTAEQLLTTILEGTGWKVGNVAQFFEDDGTTIKSRSITASTKTGAFKLISTMCEKFDAKPIYHGDSRTVDIVPMNPFSEVEGSDIPQEVLDGENVLELYYNRNISSIKRTLDSRNLVTRLYAYGSYGDVDTGMCSLQNCEHKEYIFTISDNYENQEFSFKDSFDSAFYFTGDLSLGDELVWSELDPLSKSYVWNKTKEIAYRVYKSPKTEYSSIVQLDSTIEEVKNKADYVNDFSYYEKVGLLTDDMLQELARYQREMPDLMDQSMEASTNLIEKQMELSEVAESNTDFLRLDVQSYTSGPAGEIKLILNKNVHPDGVIYRSDYLEAKRNYFSWYCAEALKDNGDPVSGPASVVYIIHESDPQKWEKGFVKYIDDKAENNLYGTVGHTDPSSITLWLDRSKVPNLKETDRIYLFCTNSNSGRMGTKETEMEGIEQTIQTTTKHVTVEHPTYFVWDDDDAPSTDAILSATSSAVVGSETDVSQRKYGWYYRSYSTTMDRGDLYFCYGSAGETDWHSVVINDELPSEVIGGGYFFDTRSRKLYRGENDSWVWLKEEDHPNVPTDFSNVIDACLKHDEVFKGIYDKYIYTAESDLPAENYAIKNDFGYHWVFSTDRTISSGNSLYIDTQRNLVFQTDSVEDIVKPVVKPDKTIDFPVANELEDIAWTEGTLNKESGAEVGSTTMYRCNYITLHPGVRYRYHLPAGGFVVFYNTKRRFIKMLTLPNEEGYIDTTEDTKSVRFVIPAEIRQEDYLQVENYLNKLFVSNVEYTILSPITYDGDRTGLMYLIKKFADISDECYQIYYPAYTTAQSAIKERNNHLAETLGDLYREGYWQENDYVSGDEDKLYKDALENIVKIAKPEATYEIDFLDLYSSNKGIGYSIDESEDIEWPDIEITDAVHLVDDDIDINCWAFIDKFEKCYDQPWKTKLQINTNLSLLGQHTFTDVMAHIAEVANETQAMQTIYKRAAALSGTGQLTADKLAGSIQTNITMLTGGSSNWHTDEKGNIILEAADGQSAMILTGAGFGVANSKNEWGDWDFRYTTTGQGMTADVINAGTISGVLIEAGSITTDQINASVGQELDIGSNKSLLLYATQDGLRPAGSLQTQVDNGDGTYRPVGEGDSYIQIAAADETNKAAINIATGGNLNLYGSDMNLTAESNMNISGSTVNIESDSDMTLSSGSTLSIESDGEFLVDSPNFSIKRDDSVTGGHKVTVEGKLVSSEGEIAGFTLQDKNGVKSMYAGATDNLNSYGNGVYLGTDGVNLGGGKLVYSTENEDLRIKAEYASIGRPGQGDALAASFYSDGGSHPKPDLSTLQIGETYYITGSINYKEDGVTYGPIDMSGSFVWEGNGTVYTKGEYSILLDSTGVLYYHNDDVIAGCYASSDNPDGSRIIGIHESAGAVITIDAQAGTIDLDAQSTININANNTVNIAAGNSLTLASSGNVYIGNAGSVFTVGSDGTNSYIYNGMESRNDTEHDGVYVGTDGIALGKGVFKVTNEGALDATSATIAGNITAESGYIGAYLDSNGNYTGGWVIGQNLIYSDNGSVAFCSDPNSNFRIYAGDATAANAAFYVLKDGSIHATKGDIAGWTIEATKLISSNKLVGISSDPLSDNTGIAFYAGDATPASAPFIVNHKGELKASNAEITGTIYANDGTIGGWYIGEDFIGNGNTKNCGVGLQSTEDTSKQVIWAGYTETIDPETGDTVGHNVFYVRGDGYLYATNAHIEGDVTATSGSFTGTVTASSGNIGGFKINATYLSTNDKASYSSNVAGVYLGNDGIGLGDGKFYVTSAGALHAEGADVSGKITASEGRIGGWYIGSNYIGNGDSINCSVGMQSTTNANSQVIWAGYKYNDGNNPESTFYVTAGGYIYAKSGSIGGWNMSPGENNSTLNRLFSGTGTNYVAMDSGTGSYAFWAGNEDPTKAPFRVLRNGTVVLTSLQALGSDGVTTSNVNLRQAGLWKIAGNGQTITSYTDKKSITLSNGDVVNFNSANVFDSFFTSTAGSGSGSVTLTVSARNENGDKIGSEGTITINEDASNKKVTIKSTNVGTINAEVNCNEIYNAGWSDYWNSSHWARPTESSGTVKIPGQTPTTGQVAWFILSSKASITYNSTTHKYTATGQAYIGSTKAAPADTATSGTDAYEDGQSSMGVTSSWGTGTTSNTFTVTTKANSNESSASCVVTAYASKTALNPGDSVVVEARGNGTKRDSVTITANAIPEATLTAQYNAGWNACRLAVVNSGETVNAMTQGTKRGILYVAPTGGAQSYSNCYSDVVIDSKVKTYTIPDVK